MKLVICAAALLVATSAFADGPAQQYDEAIVTKMSLDPGESVENDDGVKEDPNAQMSPTARAFRNGIYNGRKMQKETDDSIPPLPRDMPAEAVQAPRHSPDANSRWTQIPPQPYQYSPPVAPRDQATPLYGPPPTLYGSAQGYGVAPSTYTTTTRQTYSQTTTSSYASPPAYAQPYPPQAYQQAYYPPPGPPQATYVVIPSVPNTLATGYWPRGYRPHY
jgi:hypothetical protein